MQRWRDEDPVKQSDLASFAHTVERLRAVSGKEVAAFYFTTSDYQIGALKTAVEPAVTVAVFRANQPSSGLTYSFLRYDPDREARVKHAFAHLTASVGFSATVSAVVIRADDKREPGVA